MTDFPAFLDVYLDDLIIGFPCFSTPRFSTQIAASFNGSEVRNRNWLHPLRKFSLPEAVREHPQYEALQAHWYVMGGPERSWPFTDPLDFASRALDLPNVVPDITATDQVIGTGNDQQRAFQLVKRYTVGGETYSRPITLPQEDTTIVMIDGLLPEEVPIDKGGPYAWAVSRPGGIVTFDKAPKEGLQVTAGFLFDVAVRFEADDTFDGIVQSYQVSGFSDLDLVEVRGC